MAARAISYDDPIWKMATPNVVVLSDERAMKRERIIEWASQNGDGFFSWRWQTSNPNPEDDLGYRIEIHLQFTCQTSAMAFKMTWA